MRFIVTPVRRNQTPKPCRNTAPLTWRRFGEIDYQTLNEDREMKWPDKNTHFFHLPLNGCIIQNRGFSYSQKIPETVLYPKGCLFYFCCLHHELMQGSRVQNYNQVTGCKSEVGGHSG
ncbi:hypothetical protein Bca101_018410 [Brassica carinata]